MSNTVVHKNYINGLKGFACLMVMFGHFIGIYKYAEEFPASSSFLKFFDSFLGSKLSFAIDETFWVILFFFVSGYLVSMSKVSNFNTFLFKCFIRFIRLGVPILFACGIIFIIQETTGFYTAETLDVFENSFLQKNYTDSFSFWQVLKAPVDVLVLGNIVFCGPYWVLREMFVTSIIIYFFTWLKNKTNSVFFLIALLVVFVSSMVLSNVIFAGVFGMLVNLLENDIEKKYMNSKIFLLFVTFFSVSLYFIPRSRLASIFFGCLVIVVPKLPILNDVLSSKAAQFLNKISFGIYSFHWPVFCSAGMLTLIKTYERIGVLGACALAAIISFIMTVVISVLYYFLFEKQFYKCLKKAESFWRKINE